MVRGLLIDPEGSFAPIWLEKLKVPREMYMGGRENVIMHKGQLIAYQMQQAAKPGSKNIFVLRGCRFEYLGQLPFKAQSCDWTRSILSNR